MADDEDPWDRAVREHERARFMREFERHDSGNTGAMLGVNEFNDLLSRRATYAEHCVQMRYELKVAAQKAQDEYNYTEHRRKNPWEHWYVDDRLPSSTDHPLGGYRVPAPFVDQCARLKARLGISFYDDFDKSALGAPLEQFAEGYSAIPDWKAVAPTYENAVKIVFSALSSFYGQNHFVNELTGNSLDHMFYRPREQTIECMTRIKQQQKGRRILAVQTQLGLRHRFRSPDEYRKVSEASEFGLGAFAVGCILLAEEKPRFRTYDTIWPRCVGDEFRYFGSDWFTYTPAYFLQRCQLFFYVDHNNRCGSYSGAVTAFIPSK